MNTAAIILFAIMAASSGRPVVVPGPVCAGQTDQVRIGPAGYFAPVCEDMVARADLLFEYNSAKLKPSANEMILKWKSMLTGDTAAWFIDGHADNHGTERYNNALSMKRAQAVRDALVKQGIPLSRLAPRGLGESRPVAPNTFENGDDNPEGRAMNRRVEFAKQ